MKTALAIVIFFLPLVFLSEGFCTQEYAGQTGKNCGECHVEAVGGGKLTAAGEAFRDDLRIKGHFRPLTQTQKIVRFIIGYIHTITAIMWFGTILYVHILLKPAYAAGGLPKGELMLGWLSIFIMTITGTLLSLARVPSWDMLFHTRFGILLTIKIALFMVMVSTAIFVTFVIGPRLRRKMQCDIKNCKQDLNHEQLSHCDGKDGRPAYIAYNGIIYDVAGSKLWKSGSHMAKHAAGHDLTDILKQAPHGEDRVLKMPVIGKLLQTDKSERPVPMKLFYFFAYMNLIFVFLIVFVISLWRWW
ncbi:MAG: CopD family protein [Nitrospirae bacterium]|nr:CopD family protein [Nitrospirota bacterium]